MSRRETAQYLPLAWLTAPAIHLFFSLFVGWHDYMPFPVYTCVAIAEEARLDNSSYDGVAQTKGCR
jgi:hypothetical protein